MRQDPRSAGKEALRQHRIIAPSAFAGYFSPIHRFEKFEVLRSRWRLCRLTDAACPLRVHKVQLHFSYLALPKNLSPSALVDQFRASLDFARAFDFVHAIVGAGHAPPGAAPARCVIARSEATWQSREGSYDFADSFPTMQPDPARLHPKGTSSRCALRAPRRPAASSQ